MPLVWLQTSCPPCGSSCASPWSRVLEELGFLRPVSLLSFSSLRSFVTASAQTCFHARYDSLRCRQGPQGMTQLLRLCEGETVTCRIPGVAATLMNCLQKLRGLFTKSAGIFSFLCFPKYFIIIFLTIYIFIYSDRRKHGEAGNDLFQQPRPSYYLNPRR